jgi:hypothetical protein
MLRFFRRRVRRRRRARIFVPSFSRASFHRAQRIPDARKTTGMLAWLPRENDKPETPIYRLAHEIGRAGRTWMAFWSLGGFVHPDLTRDWMRRCPYDWSATVDIAARIPNECWPIAPSLN